MNRNCLERYLGRARGTRSPTLDGVFNGIYSATIMRFLAHTAPKNRRRSTSNLKLFPVIESRAHLKPNITMSNSELAASYAALILADDGVEVTVSSPDSELVLIPRNRRQGAVKL